MKIMLVNKYYYCRGGAEAHMLDMQALFEEHGHQTIVFSMTHASNRPSPYARYFARESDYRATSLAHRFASGIRLVYNTDARWRIGKLLADEPVDVAHIHNIYHQISPSILPVLTERRVPVVMSVHDLKLACASYKMLANGTPCERCRGGHHYHAILVGCHEGSRIHGALLALEAYCHQLLRSYTRHVSAFLCPSRFYADKLREHGMPSDRVKVLPYFLDTRYYEPVYTPGEGIAYFGRLSTEKGLATLIRAMRAFPRTTLTIIGEGPLRAEIEALAGSLGVRVNFAGRLDGRALHDAVRRARVCVIASEWYENLPVSVMEAFALGRVVVGSRIGGIPELVLPGHTGWLFEPGNEESLAAALETAMSCGRLEEMGREARGFVETEFAPETYYRRLLSIYAEIGSGSSR